MEKHPPARIDRTHLKRDKANPLFASQTAVAAVAPPAGPATVASSGSETTLGLGGKPFRGTLQPNHQPETTTAPPDHIQIRAAAASYATEDKENRLEDSDGLEDKDPTDLGSEEEEEEPPRRRKHAKTSGKSTASAQSSVSSSSRKLTKAQKSAADNNSTEDEEDERDPDLDKVNQQHKK